MTHRISLFTALTASERSAESGLCVVPEAAGLWRHSHMQCSTTGTDWAQSRHHACWWGYGALPATLLIHFYFRLQPTPTQVLTATVRTYSCTFLSSGTLHQHFIFFFVFWLLSSSGVVKTSKLTLKLVSCVCCEQCIKYAMSIFMQYQNFTRKLVASANSICLCPFWTTSFPVRLSSLSFYGLFLIQSKTTLEKRGGSPTLLWWNNLSVCFINKYIYIYIIYEGGLSRNCLPLVSIILPKNTILHNHTSKFWINQSVHWFMRCYTKRVLFLLSKQCHDKIEGAMYSIVVTVCSHSMIKWVLCIWLTTGVRCTQAE